MVPCMNCKKPMKQEEAKIFAECLLCPDCYRVAERIYQQAQNELQQLLLTMKESLRLSIVRGQLGFSQRQESVAASDPAQAPKAIDFIIDMMKEKKCQSSRLKNSSTTSTPTSRLPALTAGGVETSASTQTQESE